MNTPRLAPALAAALLAAGSLAGCASTPAPPPTAPATSSSAPSSAPVTPDGPTEGPVIAPITMSADDLQGATVDLEIGQVLDIDTGSLAVDSYSGAVADPSVAEFTAGRDDGSATFNPGVTGLATGSTQVTLSNSDGGIQDVVFTVTVSAAR